MQRFLEYMKEHKRRIIAPIGGELPGEVEYESDLKLFCCSFIEMCKAFGLKTTYYPSSGLEKVSEGQIQSMDFFDSYDFQNARRTFLDTYQKELSSFMTNCSQGFVVTGCFGPTTVAAEMIGVENFIRLQRKNPRWMDRLIGLASELIMDIAQICEMEEADYFWIAEPTAVLLSPKSFRRYSGLPLQEVFMHTKLPSFLHVCGDTTRHTEELVKTGAQCLSLDHCVDLEEMIQRTPEHVWLMGNVDPMILYSEDLAVVEKAILNQLQVMEEYTRYIVSTGCLLPKGTPEDHIRRLYDISRAYGILDFK